MQRISTNMPNEDMQYHLRIREWRMNELQNKIAEQTRIKELRDDPVGAAHSTRYQSLLARLNRYTETIGTVEVPNGTYQQLRFKFHKDEDLAQSEPLFDRSLFIKGMVGDKPFELWHDTSENFDIGKNEGIVVANNEIDLIVNFSVSQFLRSLHEVDLSLAEDRDQNGLIEINTNDSDGNKEIVDAIKENIKFSADLIKQ